MSTMHKQKRIFLWIAGLVLVGLGYASYDIAQRTTFPGSKSHMEETFSGKNDDVGGHDKDNDSKLQQDTLGN